MKVDGGPVSSIITSPVLVIIWEDSTATGRKSPEHDHVTPVCCNKTNKDTCHVNFKDDVNMAPANTNNGKLSNRFEAIILV